MSYYVKRTRDGREGWTGSIRSERQAAREAAAWRDAGWTADVVENTPAIRREVRDWQRARDLEHGRGRAR